MTEAEVKTLRDIATRLKAADTAREKELEMLETLASTLKQVSVKMAIAVNKGDVAKINHLSETLGEISDSLQAFVEGQK